MNECRFQHTKLRGVRAFPKKKTHAKREDFVVVPRATTTPRVFFSLCCSLEARAQRKKTKRKCSKISLFFWGSLFFFVPLGFRVKKEKVPSVFFSFFFALRKRHFFRTGYFFPLLMSTSSSSLTSPLSSLERRRCSSSLGKQQRCATTRVSRPLFFFLRERVFFFHSRFGARL